MRDAAAWLLIAELARLLLIPDARTYVRTYVQHACMEHSVCVCVCVYVVWERGILGYSYVASSS